MLLGARRISPIPPPFLSPWFNVVTIHMTNESQDLSLTSSPDTATSTFSCSEITSFDITVLFHVYSHNVAFLYEGRQESIRPLLTFRHRASSI